MRQAQKAAFGLTGPQRNIQFTHGAGRTFSTPVEFTLDNEFKGFNIEVPGPTVSCTKEELIDMFKIMAYYRRLEIVCDTMYKEAKIRGFCHLYDGQEAVVVGMQKAFRPGKNGDSVITAYRDHCHQIACGDTGASMMAELTGRVTGCSKGKGGSMHLYYPEGNFYGGNGIVGAQVPVGVGLAFTHKYNGDGGASISFYGDGAANQGQVYEAANMAALWKLPAVFVCENNNYAMGTSTARHTTAPFYKKLGMAGIPGIWADGMDVLGAKKCFEFALEYARENGPIMVELSTYRYHGHSMSDPGISYRSREEVAEIRSRRDCIEKVKQRLLTQEWATAKEIKQMERDIKKQVDSDAKFAVDSPLPPIEDWATCIYGGNSPDAPFVRAVELEDSVGYGDYAAYRN